MLKSLALGLFSSSKSLGSYYRDKVALRQDRELRRLVKIAVIDDQPFTPHENLKVYNYNITAIGDIRSIEMVEQYDIVLCDIIGVGLAFNANLQGASVIAEIRKTYPEKIVLAYTGAGLNQSATKEAKSTADSLIKKDTTIQEWVAKLDFYIKQTMNPVAAWDRIRIDLTQRGVDTKDILVLEDAFTRSFSGGVPSPRILQNTIQRMQVGDDVRNIINGLISSALYSQFSVASS